MLHIVVSNLTAGSISKTLQNDYASDETFPSKRKYEDTLKMRSSLNLATKPNDCEVHNLFLKKPSISYRDTFSQTGQANIGYNYVV